MAKVSKNERVRQAIRDLKDPHFTVNDIHNAVNQYGISIKNVQQALFYATKHGLIRRIQRTGGGRPATYTRELIQTPPPKQIPLPENLPLETVGEAILATFKLLKTQVFKAEEQIEKLGTECNRLRKECRDLQKTIKAKDEELKTIGEALRTQTGKTFPMAEIARVIRNGRLVVQ